MHFLNLQNNREQTVMDPAERTTIEQRLVETGEKERLKEHLRNRLIESGWREELKLEAKQVSSV